MFEVIKRVLVGGQTTESWLVESDERIFVSDVMDYLGDDALAHGFRCWPTGKKYRASWAEWASQEVLENYHHHTHQYRIGENVGRCLTRYTCEICGEYYEIDSSD